MHRLVRPGALLRSYGGCVRPLSSSVDAHEVQKFAGLSKAWWDPNSSAGTGPLHRMNPVRVQFIRSCVEACLPSQPSHMPLRGLNVLDVGCGGGLLSESLARLGGAVTGIDVASENVGVAKWHCLHDPATSAIDYRVSSAEDLAAARAGQFDIVLSLEVIEHVADTQSFMDALARLLKPSGLLFLSTLNRTAKAYALAIVGAEYVAGLVPVGTHDWERFVPPDELQHWMEQRNVRMVSRSGMAYNPLTRQWRLTPDDLDVNYIVCGRQS